jgi:hypothetical protein
MSDLEKTLAAIDYRGWRVVLLPAKSKRPNKRPWPITGEPAVVKAHLCGGGNAGLVCGPDSDVSVVDIDKIEPARDMMKTLGRLRPWVRTGSGAGHAYFTWREGLPAKVTWAGRVIGEIQRGPVTADETSLQHVVMPPSVHPGGGVYKWLVDPAAEPLGPLPDTYVEMWAATQERPATTEGVDVDVEAATAVALRQPGASKRRDAVKFACPQCRRDGHDIHQDNAIFYFAGEHAGRWGCAFAPKDKKHRAAIARALTGKDVIPTTSEHRKWL